MRDLRRLIALAGLAIVAFVAALVTFGEDAEAACAVSAGMDPSYDVQMQDEPVTGQRVYRLSITRSGARVAGARVCIRADLEGMSAMGVSAEAVELQPGIYQFSVDFEMAGPWEGTVVVDEGHRPPVGVPLSIDVA